MSYPLKGTQRDGRGAPEHDDAHPLRVILAEVGLWVEKDSGRKGSVKTPYGKIIWVPTS
jgi:hypothetical protein